MSGICRAFTLYHDKLILSTNTTTETFNLEKDYHVIGYFDWFETKTFPMISERSLGELFKYNSELNETVSEYQAFQNVFGFIENSAKDSKFWDNSSTEALKFILFLQVEKYNENMYKSINNILNQKCKNNKNYIVYYTLDKNDFVICFKSNKYTNVMDIINHLYRECIKERINIIYSYTNLLLKNVENIDKNYFSKSNELIDSICIKTILNNSYLTSIDITEKISLFTNALSEAFYGQNSKNKFSDKDIIGYEILGDTDCRFIARNVPLNKLLKQFLESGLMSKKNKLFSSLFLSSMTSLNIVQSKFGFDIELTNNILNQDYEQRSSNLQTNVNSHIEESQKQKIEEIKNSLGNEYIPIISLLHRINNYILYTGYQSARYESITLKEPFDTLLYSISKNAEKIKNGLISTDELYEYLNNIYNNIQENMRTDIRFFGISDYSMMPYYSPTKLRAFYSIIANKISDHYSKMSELDNNIYNKFVISFTYSQATYVDQLWRELIGGHNLMLVNVTENDFYHIKDLIFQFAHEAAHFVGNEKIRNREYRLVIILKFLFNCFIYGFKEHCINELLESNDKLDNELLFLLNNSFDEIPFDTFYEDNIEIVNSNLCTYMKHLKQSKFISNESDFYYMHVVENWISDFLFNSDNLMLILIKYTNNLFCNIKQKALTSQKSLKDISCMISRLKTIYNRFINSIDKMKEDLITSNNSDFNYVKKLMSESYADISAIVLFDLSAEDYLSFISKRIHNNISDKETIDYEYLAENSLLFQRSCIVLKAFSKFQNKNGLENIDSYKQFLSEMPNKWKSKSKYYETITKTCCAFEKNITHPCHYAYEYILKCIESHISKCDTIEQKDLKTVYDQISSEDILSTIKYINIFITDS
ncbi:MAG: hypothetical protein IJE16_00350 [Ruminococcus sp.]|nr:hypothetical protein [Ruminococcus sp.]